MQSDAQSEIRRLQKELKQVTDESDILKRAAYFAKCPTKVRLYPRQQLLRAYSSALSGLDVHPGGFYVWHQQPHSQRNQADQILTGQIKQF